jgi:hypothetical protein
MAIDAEQRRLRATRIGSSDAPRIMAGEWRAVWLEKTGRKAAPDLDGVPAVQIGVATEHLHGRFRMRRTGIASLPAGRTFVHPEHPWMVAHPDFLTWSEPPLDPGEPPDAVMEAKFCSGFLTDEDLAEKHWWQVQHQLACTGLARAVLSVLRPSDYSAVPIGRSEADVAVLVETLRAFWWHVENDVEPEGDPLAVEPPEVERARVLDMALDNEFADLGRTLIAARASVEASRSAERRIKALMPADCRVAFLRGEAEGAGLVLIRGRDGRLSMRFGAPPRRDRDRAETWIPDGRRAGDGAHGGGR